VLRMLPWSAQSGLKPTVFSDTRRGPPQTWSAVRSKLCPAPQGEVGSEVVQDSCQLTHRRDCVFAVTCVRQDDDEQIGIRGALLLVLWSLSRISPKRWMIRRAPGCYYRPCPYKILASAAPRCGDVNFQRRSSFQTTCVSLSLPFTLLRACSCGPKFGSESIHVHRCTLTCTPRFFMIALAVHR
jgi:hypothetical protein